MSDSEQLTQAEIIRDLGRVPGGRRYLTQRALLEHGVFIRGSRRNPRNLPGEPQPDAAP